MNTKGGKQPLYHKPINGRTSITILEVPLFKKCRASSSIFEKEGRCFVIVRSSQISSVEASRRRQQGGSTPNKKKGGNQNRSRRHHFFNVELLFLFCFDIEKRNCVVFSRREGIKKHTFWEPKGNLFPRTKPKDAKIELMTLPPPKKTDQNQLMTQWVLKYKAITSPPSIFGHF